MSAQECSKENNHFLYKNRTLFLAKERAILILKMSSTGFRLKTKGMLNNAKQKPSIRGSNELRERMKNSIAPLSLTRVPSSPM